jgi:hypothetical protein
MAADRAAPREARKPHDGRGQRRPGAAKVEEHQNAWIAREPRRRTWDASRQHGLHGGGLWAQIKSEDGRGLESGGSGWPMTWNFDKPYGTRVRGAGVGMARRRQWALRSPGNAGACRSRFRATVTMRARRLWTAAHHKIPPAVMHNNRVPPGSHASAADGGPPPARHTRAHIGTTTTLTSTTQRSRRVWAYARGRSPTQAILAGNQAPSVVKRGEPSLDVVTQPR